MRIEDDEPPIKSHPASKEYRANYDTIDWGPDEPRVGAGGNTVEDYWTPSPIDPKILETLDKFKNLAGGLGTIVNGEFFVNPEAEKLGLRVGVDTAERRALDRGEECKDCGSKPPGQCDEAIHEALENANSRAVREYLADGGEPSPIGWYGVVDVSAPKGVTVGWNCPVCETGTPIQTVDTGTRTFSCCDVLDHSFGEVDAPRLNDVAENQHD